MKKILAWWYNYRMITSVMAGVRFLLKSHQYNSMDLNLGSVGRQFEWAGNTIGYLDMPGWLRAYVIWRFKRLRKVVDNFDFAGTNQIDGWNRAMQFANNHMCPDPVVEANLPLAQPPIEEQRETEQTYLQRVKDEAKKGKYEDG